MNELTRHIEILLIENDCVILPDLGGLITHYIPSQCVDDIFLPPTRIVGFNPQLKMNDGLLTQSYMARHATDFADAAKRLKRDMDELLDTLYNNGSVELPAIGCLNYNIHSRISFTPYDRRLAAPELFGLDSFRMQELSALTTPTATSVSTPPQLEPQDEPTRVHRHIRRSINYLPRVAAIAIGFMLLFFFSTPIDHKMLSKQSHAQLMPTELLKPVEPIELVQPATHPATLPTRAMSPSKAITSVAKQYHIIVASMPTEHDAITMAKTLIARGYHEAKAIVGGGKKRVAVTSYATQGEAYDALLDIREGGGFANAWILKH
ncbi:MAG: SPOR domain-containing protein [Mediterranea sp.]|jgi:hypothetical protein|nr:SPOR domain-containing protein [Mediterranea sp.]